MAKKASSHNQVGQITIFDNISPSLPPTAPAAKSTPKPAAPAKEQSPPAVEPAQAGEVPTQSIHVDVHVSVKANAEKVKRRNRKYQRQRRRKLKKAGFGRLEVHLPEGLIARARVHIEQPKSTMDQLVAKALEQILPSIRPSTDL